MLIKCSLTLSVIYNQVSRASRPCKPNLEKGTHAIEDVGLVDTVSLGRTGKWPESRKKRGNTEVVAIYERRSRACISRFRGPSLVNS